VQGPVIAINSPSQPRFEPYVDADAVAEFTGYDRQTVLRYTREGVFRGYPPPGKKRRRNYWRYKLSEVDADMRSTVDSKRRPCRPHGDKLQ
jgi:hypothetical protein